MSERPTTVTEAWALNKRNMLPHPYCPDEDGRCQYGRDEDCPGIERIKDDDPLHTGDIPDDLYDLLMEEKS